VAVEVPEGPVDGGYVPAQIHDSPGRRLAGLLPLLLLALLALLPLSRRGPRHLLQGQDGALEHASEIRDVAGFH
jgi:hypothetical protein